MAVIAVGVTSRVRLAGAGCPPAADRWNRIKQRQKMSDVIGHAPVSRTASRVLCPSVIGWWFESACPGRPEGTALDPSFQGDLGGVDHAARPVQP